MLNFKTIPFIHPYILPRGEYVITDPCYLFSDDNLWQKLVDEVFCDRNNTQSCGIVEIEGHAIWWGNTHHGDGLYSVIKNSESLGEFGVDAGLYAIIPREFIAKHCDEDYLFDDAGLAVELTMGGAAIYYHDGNMRCGKIDVQTDYQAGEDMEDEDDEDFSH